MAQLAKASNAIHRDDFVLFASSPARPVRGIVTMEFYIHTNPGVRLRGRTASPVWRPR